VIRVGRRTRTGWAEGLVVVGLVWLGVQIYQAQDESPGGDAAAELAELEIAEEVPGAPYVREQWGAGWPVTDGCSLRELVLERQGTGVQRGKGCTPVCPPAPAGGERVTACWTSAYDGRRVGDADDLQIDHRVPLEEAARSVVEGTGTAAAERWTAERKHAFYVDVANLVAVTVHSNTSKGSRDPGEWLPSNDWCGYAKAYVAVKHEYQLTVDRREHDALEGALATCEDEAGGSK
jgi:hypothetical protein